MDGEILLEPLGLWRQRTDELGRAAARLVDGNPSTSREPVLEWYGIGKYVANCYAVFVLGDRSVEPTDEKLRAFLEEE